MSSDVVIRASGLTKHYQIYAAPRDRLKQFLLPRLQRTFGFVERHYFRDFAALEDVSFEVRRGETFGIVGRNGAGKSTLLQILCGTLAPTGGNVEVSGRVAALLELGAGFNPEFTGRENVFMNARVLGLAQELIESRLEAIEAFADIGDFFEQPVKTYSSGMYLRLAFAVIAHVDADVLVVDEALAVGDAYFVQKCMRFLRRFMDHGTLLFVSHDTGAVLNLCSRAVLLEKGRLTAVGAPKQVVQRYLSALVEENQGALAVDEAAPATEPAPADAASERDFRQDLINGSAYRNEIEIFRFNDRSSGFGTRLASIRNVRLLDEQGAVLSWIVGGERVQLCIECSVTAEIDRPIVGFQLLDRLGQTLFSDNTFLAYRGRAPHVAAGHTLEAVFEFRLPRLPSGDYSFCVAVAEGTQDSHVQHHWMNDALIIRVHSDTGVQGLVGVPMLRIALRAEDPAGDAHAA